MVKVTLIWVAISYIDASLREANLLPLIVGTKRREGAAAMSERGTPFSKIAVIEVASVITADELSIPLKMTIASYPLVGNEAPVIRILVGELTAAPITEGEFALSYSKLHSAALRVLPQV